MRRHAAVLALVAALTATLAFAEETVLVLKDGRRITVSEVYRFGDKVRFTEASTGRKRQVPAGDVVSPDVASLPAGPAPSAAHPPAEAIPPGVEPLREPVRIKLADGREIDAVDVHRTADRVRFQVAGTKEKRQVPYADIASPALDRIPYELRLADGRVLRVVGLYRQGTKVRFQVMPGGERRQVEENQVEPTLLASLPVAGVAVATGPTTPVTPASPPPGPLTPAAPEVPTPPAPARPPLAVASVDTQPMTSRWDLLDALPPNGRWVPVNRHLDPYNQNTLKGDRPVIGDDVFVVLTGTLDALTEARRLPVGSGVSTADPASYGFFGRGEQVFTTPRALFSVELFKGQTAFRPKTWSIKATGAANLNYLDTRENNIVHIDPREGTNRQRTDVALQEGYAEVKLADLSPSFDVVSLRAGIQPFISDFRGFVFADTNLGARLFGNASTNRWQYNLVGFDLLEKQTNSELNTFDRRHHQVVIANLFRQDVFRHGYQMELSYHLSMDRASDERYYDANHFLVRPARIGSPVLHDITTHYLGWAGDGHLGRLNLTHAAYYVFGHDDQPPLGPRFNDGQDVRGGMAALELSLDRDWVRFRLSGFFASGDDDATDGTAHGFDSVYDAPSFAGGPFSFWSRSGIPLTQTSVLLKAPDSLLPDLRSSKFEGQANHVNPGVLLGGLGVDLELTPKVRAVLNANYLRFHKTGALELLLFQPDIHKAIGVDLGGGLVWRPLLSENVVVTAGVTGLLAGKGFEDVYSSSCAVAGCAASKRSLFNTFLQLRLTY